MKRIPFFVIDAFTDTPFQGNPAGVFFDFEGVLSAEEMRLFAGEVSLESAFVLPGGPEADFRLRYFTGVTEVPLCGHDTVAAAFALVHAGHVSPNRTIRFINNVGPLPVEVSRNECSGLVTATLLQTPHSLGGPLPDSVAAEAAAALGCAPEALRDIDLPARVVSTGTPWLYAPVRDRACVDAVVPNYAAITRLSQQHQTFGVYVFALERDEGTGSLSVWSRCFAPVAGINEDPVTGSASGGLGWLLHDAGLLPADTCLIAQQGWGGGRGGAAHITVQAGGDGSNRPERIAVSGTATLIAEGTFLHR